MITKPGKITPGFINDLGNLPDGSDLQVFWKYLYYHPTVHWPFIFPADIPGKKQSFWQTTEQNNQHNDPDPFIQAEMLYNLFNQLNHDPCSTHIDHNSLYDGIRNDPPDDGF